MKNLLLSVTLIVGVLCFAPHKSIAQTQSSNSFVTRSMAMKISIACEVNANVAAYLAMSVGMYPGYEFNRLVYDLEHHLDYAERFLINILDYYGIDGGTGILKSTMHFTMPEIDIVVAERDKAIARANVRKEAERKEREAVLLKRINADEVFSEKELSKKPNIEIDIDDMIARVVPNDTAEQMNYAFHFIMRSTGELTLANPSDTLEYSELQRCIYHYLSDKRNLVTCRTGSMRISGEDVPVNSPISITFNEGEKERKCERISYSSYYSPLARITIKRDNKKEKWEFATTRSEMNNVAAIIIGKDTQCGKNADDFASDLLDVINSSITLSKLKGTKELWINSISKRVLTSNVAKDAILSFEFKIVYRKTKLNAQYPKYKSL